VGPTAREKGLALRFFRAAPAARVRPGGGQPRRLPVYAVNPAMNPLVVMTTSFGPLRIELFSAEAPKTVTNFLSYVEERCYDRTLFHRVISNFMIQGGGYEPGLRQKKAQPPVPSESANGLLNGRGTIAAARTASPDSATCQFFINLKDNHFLDREQSP